MQFKSLQSSRVCWNFNFFVSSFFLHGLPELGDSWRIKKWKKKKEKLILWHFMLLEKWNLKLIFSLQTDLLFSSPFLECELQLCRNSNTITFLIIQLCSNIGFETSETVGVFLINLPYFFNRVFAQFSDTIFCVKVDKGQMGRVPFRCYFTQETNQTSSSFVCTNLNCLS